MTLLFGARSLRFTALRLLRLGLGVSSSDPVSRACPSLRQDGRNRQKGWTCPAFTDSWFLGLMVSEVVCLPAGEGRRNRTLVSDDGSPGVRTRVGKRSAAARRQVGTRAGRHEITDPQQAGMRARSLSRGCGNVVRTIQRVIATEAEGVHLALANRRSLGWRRFPPPSHREPVPTGRRRLCSYWA